VAGATVGMAAATRFFGAPANGPLLIFTVAALITAYSRVTCCLWLCAFVAVMGFVQLREQRARTTVVFARTASIAGVLALIVLTMLLWNRQRFGEAFNFLPIQHHYGHPV